MEQQARHEVARVVKAERGRLRNASAPVVLAVLSGAALAPVVAAVATGSGVAGALVTLAGVAGNVGSGHLTGLAEKPLRADPGQEHGSAGTRGGSRHRGGGSRRR